MSRSRARSVTIDLSGWAGPGAAAGAAPPQRIRHVGHIVACITARPSGHEVATPVTCARRPDRHTCGAPLQAIRQDLPSAVRFSCPRCGASGTVVGFEDTVWDLRGLDLDPLPEMFEAGTFDLSLDHHAALREFADAVPEWRAVTYRTETLGRSVRMRSTPAELEALRDAVLVHVVGSGGSRVPARFASLLAALESAAWRLDCSPDLRAHEPPEFDPAPPTALVAPLLESIRHDVDVPDRHSAPVPGTLIADVTLRDVEPRTWRRLELPTEMTLGQLAQAIDVAFGWPEDDSFFAFAIGDRRFRPAEDGYYAGYEDTETVILADLLPHAGCHVVYVHDFDGEWLHDVVIIGVDERPRDHVHCVDGAGAAPPHGVENLETYVAALRALHSPRHPDHATAVELLGARFDPRAFDLTATDAAVVAQCGRRQG
ncbi:MAG: plasmid pRiA4b ORF-3 family protein [Planctomycetes bacterium]|nr:plasmid pRiA4b ORF-3 family protein [Planctomycetota bacterium]